MGAAGQSWGALEIEEEQEDPSFVPVDHGGAEQQDASFWRRLSWRLPSWLGGRQGFQRLQADDFHSGSGGDAEAAPPGAPAGRPPRRWCPEEGAGLLSRVFFLYVGPLVWLGYEKTLDMPDLWDTAAQDRAEDVSAGFARHLRSTADEFSAPQGVLWRAMWRAHRGRFISAGLLKLVHDVVMFMGPLLLEMLLKNMQHGGGAWRGLGLAAALAGSAVVETLTVNMYFHILYRISLHLKVGLVDLLYRKSLRVGAASRASLGVGSIVNLQSNDAAKLWNLPQYLHMLWSGPFQILVVLGLLVRVIHLWPAAAGLGVTIALIPMTTLVGRKLSTVRKRLLGYTDARVKLCTEVVTGIKAIKLYAWEDPYVERITAIRKEELRETRLSSFLSTINSMVFVGGPILISLAAFMTYSLLGYPLTADIAFPALSLFNLLRFPVMMFPAQIMNLINAKVALDRIQKFIDSPDMVPPPLLPPAAPLAPAAEIRRGSFSWAQDSDPFLRSIDLAVPRGSLVIVVGSVGSGKSSLLSALLGEMLVVEGSVKVHGRVAYTQQDPWIQNASLRDNVLMGAPFQAERYNRVLDACALRPDLEVLPAGDETEIGEKGVNLSGGQRHRVALARACYADADVYLLDDPLSAVDAHVGRHLFSACISGLLAEKTRVLVTHQLHYLQGSDVVVVLREGAVVEMGSYPDLLARGVDFHQFELSSSASDSEGDDGGDAVADEAAASIVGGLDTGASTGPAEASTAAAGISPDDDSAPLLDVDLHPAGSSSPPGGHEHPNGAGSPVVGLLDAAALPGSPVQGGSPANGAARSPGPSPRRGSKDSRRKSQESPKLNADEGGKSPLAVAAQKRADGSLTKAEERAVGQVDRQVYLAYFRAWSPAFAIPLAMLACGFVERGLQATQNWWLSVWSEATAAGGGGGLGGTGGTGGGGGDDSLRYMFVYFGLGLASLLFQLTKALLLVVGSVNAAAVLQSNLLTRVVRLPMSFFDSQPTGRLLNRFSKDTEAVDTAISSSVQSFLNCAVSVLWSMVVVLAVTPGVALAIVPLGLSYAWIQARYIRTSRELKRLDSLALSPIFSHFNETLQGIMTVRAFRQQAAFERHNADLLDASNQAYWPAQVVNRWLSVRLELLGISVVFGTAVLLTGIQSRNAGLAGLALTSALSLTGLMNWQVRMASELEVNMNSVERVLEYTTVEPEAPAIVPGHRPLPGWPTRGAIEVEGLVVRYRPELAPVLRGISFSVRPREKVGVAGRTGCGKSTLMLALYRLVEPTAGRILIDAIDTASIGLFDLRSRLALVPQDPVVFSGSVRSNLDPFGDAGGDDRIWDALSQAGLAATVRALAGGLDAPVAEGGANLSTGQRQLLCMARALLRTARILILDEATSNVDTTTDALIQTTIAAAFADSTVLTIAHRLHTIIDSDRILVLDSGRVREYGPPAELLRTPGSEFRSLVEETARHATAQGNRTQPARLLEGVAAPLPDQAPQ